jgi:hypothetical protein
MVLRTSCNYRRTVFGLFTCIPHHQFSVSRET